MEEVEGTGADDIKSQGYEDGCLSQEETGTLHDKQVPSHSPDDNEIEVAENL